MYKRQSVQGVGGGGLFEFLRLKVRWGYNYILNNRGLVFQITQNKTFVKFHVAMCSSRKYPYSPHGRFFVFHSLSPQEILVYFSYTASKNLASKNLPAP